MTYAGTARRARRALWLGWPIGVLVWAAWVASVALGGGLRDAIGNVVGADHLAFYTAARLTLEGRPERMYDFADPWFSAYQNEILGGGWDSVMAYRNPPFYALLYLSTAWLPFVASLWIWVGIGLVALYLGLRWLRSSSPRLAFLWALTFFPVFSAVNFGQNTLLSFAIFAGVYRLLDDRRPFLAGLAAGLLWYKPQLLLGILVWWGLMPRTHARCWLGLAVMGAALAALSWAVLPGASEAFVRSLRGNMAYAAENGWIKHSPRAFWAMALPLTRPLADNQNHPIILALWAATGLAGVAVAAGLVRRTGGPLAVTFPTAIFLSLWASPHTVIYEWSLLVAAAVVLWERFPRQRDAWLVLFVPAWVALGASTMLTQFQMEGVGVNTEYVRFRLEGRLPVAIQLSIPILAAVGGLAARQLRSAVDQPCEPAAQSGCSAVPKPA